MAVKIFFCYAHEDEPYLNKLKAYLRPLQRQGLIDVWYDRDISAGSEWEREIGQRLNEAQIILLLVSPDFMNSDYCYSVEMKRALERHERKEAMVIPVIVRPIYWQGVLGNIQALPTDAKPLVDRYWHTLDEAFYDVAEGIRKVVMQLGTPTVSPSEVPPCQTSKGEPTNGSLTVLTPHPAKPPSSIKLEVLYLMRTLDGHKSTVLSVTISPDGQTLASSCHYGRIKLWSLTTGTELRSNLRGHFWGSVNSVAFSPDGRTLASGSSDKKIKLWDLATDQELRTLTGHTDWVLSVVFSPDGQTLASGSHDGTIKLWNLASRKEVRTLTGHTSYVSSVAFSPDGQTLASGSHDGTIKLWNLHTGQLLVSFKEHSHKVVSVAISPDGQILASGSIDQTIKLWQLPAADPLRTLKGHINAIFSVAISSDGQTLASGSADNTIKLWNLHTGQLLHTLEGHSGPISSVAISPDGQMLVSGSFDQTIKIWGKK